MDNTIQSNTKRFLFLKNYLMFIEEGSFANTEPQHSFPVSGTSFKNWA